MNKKFGKRKPQGIVSYVMLNNPWLTFIFLILLIKSFHFHNDMQYQENNLKPLLHKEMKV